MGVLTVLLYRPSNLDKTGSLEGVFVQILDNALILIVEDEVVGDESLDCWETESARPSPLVPVKSNLIVIPTSLPECFLADLKVSSWSKIRFLLYL